MMMIDSIIKIILFSCISLTLLSQQDFKTLQYEKAKKHQKMLSQAEKEDKLLMYIIYNPEYDVNSVFLIEEPSKLNDFNERVQSVLLDWSRDSRHDILSRIKLTTNPQYVLMHPDDIILAQSNGLNGYEDLVKFYAEGSILDKKYKEAMQLAQDGNKKESIEQLINITLNQNDKERTNKLIDDWMQLASLSSDEEDIDFLINTHLTCQCSYRMDIAFGQYENRIVPKIGIDRYLHVRQTFLLSALVEAEILEPYTVWEVYEKNLGIHADSLYRLFAIEYFQSIDPDEEVLLDEVYNFLYYYPETPWDKQDELFGLAMRKTRHKDDWSLLLDLIEYQLIEDPHYRKLDYKAAILFKLGYRERAVEIMKEVEAQTKGLDPPYDSVFYKVLESK